MNAFVNKIRDFIDAHNMIAYGDSVVVGISGGADSVCLLHILCSLSGVYDLKIKCVHVNHGIRGEEANRDELFAKKIAEEFKVPFEVMSYNIPEYAKEKGLSEEEAGRKLRYEAFTNCKTDKIAVAHHMDDSCETILFNLCRGSELKGISGISPVRDNIIRPLLCVDRSEIEEYLLENKIEYIIDSTNMSNDYTRNKIRNIVIPYLKENINEQATKHIVSLAASASEAEDFLSMMAKNSYDRYVKKTDNIYEISDSIKEEQDVLVRRVVRMVFEKTSGKLKDITSAHCKQVVELFDKPVSKMVNLPYGMVAVRKYDCVKIYSEEICLNEKKPTPEVFTRKISNYEKNHKIPQKMYTKWVDCDKIQDTVDIRHRLPGDYLIVDNKGSRKKLKDYFINEKIPKEDRDDILLVADGSHIIWVVGHRISEFYKITDETRNVLEIEVKQDNGRED